FHVIRYPNTPNQEWLIAALTHQGWSYVRLAQAGAALAVAEEARGLSIRANNLATLAESLNLLGSIQYFLLGEYKVADGYFEEACTLYQQIGYRAGEATVMMNQAESANTQGDYRRAEAKIQDALSIIREAGDRMKELSMLINLSEAQVRLEDHGPAVANLTLVTAQAPPDWTYAPSAYQVLAEAYLGLDKVGQALAAVQAAASGEQEGKDPYSLAQSWRVLGLIAARLGEPVARQPASDRTYTAADCFARSLQLFTDIDNKREQATVLWAWAGYEMAQGNTAAGNAMWQEAQDIFNRLNLPLLIARMEQSLRGDFD
ncbi:MAG: tetratricopeptide repeat protein, partial [Chloroflexi bacterium]|nr:tetratricopeptide repeat protein [Chloroflexota bacterium]